MKQIFQPQTSLLRLAWHTRPWLALPNLRLGYLLAALTFLVGSALSNFVFARQALAVSASCADVQFIFARGSGEALNGPSASTWQSSLTSQLAGSNLRYDFYELGSRSVGGYQYPAVTVSDGLDGYANLIGAYVSGGGAFDFGASVRQGQGELKAVIQQISATCPATKFVLGGYSQGAMLISGLLDQLDATKIAYVATFGDPKLYLPEGEQRHDHTSRQPANYRQIPDACLGKNLSDYRAHVPDCYAYEGVLGSYRPYQPAGYLGKLGTWCNDNDIMCSSGYNISDHTAYVANDLYGDAARVIANKLAATFPHHVIISTTANTAAHDVAVLIDSTGSMSSLISRYKAEAKHLAERVLAEGGRVALFEYRDLGDPFSTKMHCDFSCTLEQFTQQIDSITTDGGGDTPESALSALLYTMNSLKWQSGATKSIVLLTDSGFLSPDRDGTTLNQVVLRSLEIDPVNVYPIGPSILKSSYTELASLTNGQVFNSAGDLRLSTDIILGRPVAKLALAEYSGPINAEFSFDASRSYGTGSGELSFDWDLDGDGVFELQDVGSIVTKTYHQPLSGFIQVRVRQGDLSSTMSAKITVRTSNEIPLATISTLSATAISDVSAEVAFQTDATKVFLTVGDAPYGFLKPTQRKFILDDLKDEIAVTLTPYDADGRKGISKQITVQPTAANPAPSSTSSATIIPTVPNTGLNNRR